MTNIRNRYQRRRPTTGGAYWQVDNPGAKFAGRDGVRLPAKFAGRDGVRVPALMKPHRAKAVEAPTVAKTGPGFGSSKPKETRRKRGPFQAASMKDTRGQRGGSYNTPALRSENESWGYPRSWDVPAQNRRGSNQPGGLMSPKPKLNDWDE